MAKKLKSQQLQGATITVAKVVVAPATASQPLVISLSEHLAKVKLQQEMKREEAAFDLLQRSRFDSEAPLGNYTPVAVAVSTQIVVATSTEIQMRHGVVFGPTLKTGVDEDVAHELDQLMEIAEQGLRIIVRLGMYLEQISLDLPHGQLLPWLQRWLPHRNVRSFQRWRQLARNILEACGIKKVALCDFSSPLHNVLALPSDQVPADAREIREKIDELIMGKSMRQLMLGFKEAEDTEDGLKVKRRGGDLTPRDEDGKRIQKPKRTKVEMELAAFELSSMRAIRDVQRGTEVMMTTEGPQGQRSWDLLDDEQLEELKLGIYDLYQGVLNTEKLRAAAVKRKGKGKQPHPSLPAHRQEALLDALASEDEDAAGLEDDQDQDHDDEESAHISPARNDIFATSSAAQRGGFNSAPQGVASGRLSPDALVRTTTNTKRKTKTK